MLCRPRDQSYIVRRELDMSNVLAAASAMIGMAVNPTVSRATAMIIARIFFFILIPPKFSIIWVFIYING